MDIRFFFVGDRLHGEGMEVIYCPTESMLADYFTKPLQGALFKKLRRVIMGMDPISSLEGIDFNSTTTVERVDNPRKEHHLTAGKVFGGKSYKEALTSKASE